MTNENTTNANIGATSAEHSAPVDGGGSPEGAGGNLENRQYIGFWSRVCAALLDFLLLAMTIFPLMGFTYSSVQEGMENFDPEGFNWTVGSAVLGYVYFAMMSFPPLAVVYGSVYLGPEHSIYAVFSEMFPDVLSSDILFVILPVVVIVAFWRWKGATPGKMVWGAKIVDEKSGKAPSVSQCIVRYFAYFASASFLLLLPFLWVAFDKKKQGLHDKLAGTVVINVGRPEPLLSRWLKRK